MRIHIAQASPLDEAGARPTLASASARDLSLPKYLVGWREWLALPELSIPGIKAKIDTGARTSALHTHDYEVFDKDGTLWVRFHLHPLVRSNRIVCDCEAPVFDQRQVKDSGGHLEDRPFIRTIVRIADVEWPVELSLTNRESMKFRMLLGRTALRVGFLVDSSRSYLMSKSLARVYPLLSPDR